MTRADYTAMDAQHQYWVYLNTLYDPADYTDCELQLLIEDVDCDPSLREAARVTLDKREIAAEFFGGVS